MTIDGFVSYIADWTVSLLSKAAIVEPVFFVCVAYDLEGDDFPVPMIGVGLDEERRQSPAAAAIARAITRYGESRRSGYYNPANFRHFESGAFVADTAELGKLASGISRTPDAQPGNPWPAFYVRVAQEIQRRDLGDRLLRTEDFVVFATDIHMEHWASSFRACVPLERRQRLRDDGWLPSAIADLAGAADP